LAIAFALLMVARISAIHRRRIVARWPTFALAAAAILAMWRGAVGPTVGLLVLAVVAWFVSPMLFERAPAPAAPRPAEAEARAILGVGLAATPDEIRAAYRRKIAAAHPDRGGSHEQAARLTTARDTLLNGRR
jgi:hypothetical protein